MNVSLTFLLIAIRENMVVESFLIKKINFLSVGLHPCVEPVHVYCSRRLEEDAECPRIGVPEG